MLKRLALVVSLVLMACVSFTTPLHAQQPPQPQQPSAQPQAPATGQTSFGQYVPIDQLPPTEKMPAAPFVISAYAIMWLLAMFYIWTIWRRVGTLEGEFRTLERRSTRKDASR